MLMKNLYLVEGVGFYLVKGVGFYLVEGVGFYLVKGFIHYPCEIVSGVYSPFFSSSRRWPTLVE